MCKASYIKERLLRVEFSKFEFALADESKRSLSIGKSSTGV